MPTNRRSSPLGQLLIAVVLLTTGAVAMTPPTVHAEEDAATTSSSPALEQNGPRDLVLEGQVTNASNGQPLPGAELSIFNEWHESEDGETTRKGHDRFVTETDEDGRYQVNVSEGWIELRAEATGYQQLHASFELTEDRTLDLPMRPLEGETVRLSGTVATPDGDPIGDASVRVQPDHHVRCDGDVCYAEASRSASEPESTTTEDGVTLRYMPHDDRYASTRTDAGGSYELVTRPGALIVRAHAAEHLDAEQRLNASEPGPYTVDLTLEPIPPDSVLVEGTVRDDVSGEPIEDARVTVENQRWGHHNTTRTDAEGTYQLRTKPGFTLVTISAEERYWVPCEDRALTDDPEDAPARHHHPGPRCEPVEREHGYLPQVRSFVGAEDASVSYDASLERQPEPTARFEGWVVNGSSEEGVPDARLSFHNEETGEWGEATTDADGSFAIDVSAGYYTIRVHAQGFFRDAVNARVAEDQTERLSIELTPGEPRYGCCYAIAERAVEHDQAAAADDAGGVSTAPASGDGTAADSRTSSPETGEATSGDGAATFEGSGGGLGPYPGSSASRNGGGEEGPASTPGPSLIATVALAALGAAVIRVYDRR